MRQGCTYSEIFSPHSGTYFYICWFSFIYFFFWYSLKIRMYDQCLTINNISFFFGQGYLHFYDRQLLLFIYLFINSCFLRHCIAYLQGIVKIKCIISSFPVQFSKISECEIKQCNIMSQIHYITEIVQDCYPATLWCVHIYVEG